MDKLKQLQALRDEYVKRRARGDIKGMKIIEIQGKLLKMKGVEQITTLDKTILEASEVFGVK